MNRPSTQRNVRHDLRSSHRWLSRIVVTLTTAVCALTVATVPANAQNTLDRAVAIVNETYPQFAHTAAGHSAPFDWSTDGCSGRWVPNVGDWKGFFRPACALHDFGYRNFGSRGALKLDPVETRRAWIDSRFLAEMERLCTDHGHGRLSPCQAAARTVYAGVRAGGGPSFYNVAAAGAT